MSSEPVRRQRSGVLLVGSIEPEVTPWLRAAGHLPRNVRRIDDALAALDEEPADLVIVDREPGGLDAPQACRGCRAGRRRRRLPAAPVLTLRADRAGARRPARGPAALRRRAAARAD